MSTLKVTSLQHASAASAAITLASDGTAAATLSSVNGGPLSGTRNRIINGDMRIDQRNAGAAVTNNASVATSVTNFITDRWKTYHYNLSGNFDTIVTSKQYQYTLLALYLCRTYRHTIASCICHE